MSIITLIDTPINTARSFFKIYNIQDKNLINNCIQEIKDKLHHSIKRQVGFFSDIVKGDYNYGKLKISTAKPLTPSLSSLLDIINTEFNSDYNGILINYYKDGNSFIPLHSDSKNHPDNGVLIISYGITRTFTIFHKKTVKLLNNIEAKEYEMLHMGGSFQEDYLHGIKKEPYITKPRYSISFHKYNNAGLYDTV
jgi:alkylated DNA repair dioxygenase AlkB